MAVRADHDLSWKDQALLREKGMLNPALTNLEIMGEMLSFGKFPENFALFGRGNVFGRREMIRDKDNPIPVKDFFYTDLLKSLNGKGGRDVIAEGKVNSHIDQLTGRNNFLSRVSREYLFSDSHRSILFHILPIFEKRMKVEAEVKVEKN
jgi:hypothetical protein